MCPLQPLCFYSITQVSWDFCCLCFYSSSLASIFYSFLPHFYDCIMIVRVLTGNQNRKKKKASIYQAFLSCKLDFPPLVNPNEQRLAVIRSGSTGEGAVLQPPQQGFLPSPFVRCPPEADMPTPSSPTFKRFFLGTCLYARLGELLLPS